PRRRVAALRVSGARARESAGLTRGADDGEEAGLGEAVPLVPRGRRSRRRRRSLTRRRVLLGAALALALLLASGAALAGSAWYVIVAGCTLEGRTPAALGSSSSLYAADGTFLGYVPSPVRRHPVPLGRVS